MLKMLRVRRGEKGFTLIELLIVVAIIGILAAVAIPQFSAYRIRGYNSAAHSDAKNMVTGQEAAFVDYAEYLNYALTTGPQATLAGTKKDGTAANIVGAKLSNNVTAKSVADSTVTGGAYYTLGTAHIQGDRIFSNESDRGNWIWNPKTAGATWDGAEVAAATSEDDVATGTAM